MKRMYRIAGLLPGLCFALSSCMTTSPEEQGLPNRTFSTITLVSPQDIASIETPETSSERFREGITTGSAGGSLGAMLVGAAACGPYLYGLCVAGLGAAGLLAGGAAGAMYGFTGISSDDAEKLSRKMATLNRRSDLQSELVAELRREVPAKMLAAPEAADVQAILTIEHLSFVKDKDEVYVEAFVRFQYATDGAEGRPEEGSQSFRGRSHRHPLDTWVEESHKELGLAVNECFERISEKISLVLVEHWRPAE